MIEYNQLLTAFAEYGECIIGSQILTTTMQGVQAGVSLKSGPASQQLAGKRFGLTAPTRGVGRL